MVKDLCLMRFMLQLRCFAKFCQITQKNYTRVQQCLALPTYADRPLKRNRLDQRLWRFSANLHARIAL